jgi:hypothetical protein
MLRTFERSSDVKAHISFMVLCCGTDFPKNGPYGNDRKKDLELAFARLREGIPLIAKKLRDTDKVIQIERLLEMSLNAYQTGERKNGAHLLQDILDIAYPKRFSEYAARKGETL